MSEIIPPAIVRPAEDLETCLANAQQHATRIASDSIAAGEWLIKAKAACPHGQWLPSLAKHGFTPRTAQRLMEAAKEKGKYDTLSYLMDKELAEKQKRLEEQISIVRKNLVWMREVASEFLGRQASNAEAVDIVVDIHEGQDAEQVLARYAPEMLAMYFGKA